MENCDSEPVHIPGHIQGYAVLIATDPTLTEVTYCSENSGEVFGKPASKIIGGPLSGLIDAKIIHDLNNTLSLSSARLQRERVAEVLIDEKAYEIWAHVSQEIPVIELEPIQDEILTQSQSILNVRSLLARLNQDQDIQKSLSEAVTGLRLLSGFDRVLAYKFDKNGDGEVKAEARGPELTPFLGLRFPKWDIPNQAREIMKKLPLRMIADINAIPVNILSTGLSAPPLDLIGNVWEWTDTDYEFTQTPNSYTIKGGSFLCAPNFCARYRAPARQSQEADFSTNHIGFRTVTRASE